MSPAIIFTEEEHFLENQPEWRLCQSLQMENALPGALNIIIQSKNRGKTHKENPPNKVEGTS